MRLIPEVTGVAVALELAMSVLFASMDCFADAYLVALIALVLLTFGVFGHAYAIRRAPEKAPPECT